MPVGRLLRAQLRRVLLDDPPDEIDPQQQEEAHWFDALHTLASALTLAGYGEVANARGAK